VGQGDVEALTRAAVLLTFVKPPCPKWFMYSHITRLSSISERTSLQLIIKSRIGTALAFNKLRIGRGTARGRKQMAAIQRDRLRIFNTSKLISIVVLSSLVVLSGCNHKTRAASRTISASTDASGSHPGSADIPGPVMVTCVSATDDTGTVTPPACVISAPGTSGVVKIGDKVAATAAGNVVLTCQGKGTLACTAQIEE